MGNLRSCDNWRGVEVHGGERVVQGIKAVDAGGEIELPDSQ